MESEQGMKNHSQRSKWKNRKIMVMEIRRQLEVILGKGRITRMEIEMENLQAMLQLRSKSLYGLVSEVKQELTNIT